MLFLLALACSDAPEPPAPEPVVEEPEVPEPEPEPEVVAHSFEARTLSGVGLEVAGSQGRHLGDYWMPATLDVEPAVMERCLNGREVRTVWPGQWAIWEVDAEGVIRDDTRVAKVGDDLARAIRVDARDLAYDYEDVARWSACWPELRGLLVLQPAGRVDTALSTLGSLLHEIDHVDILVGTTTDASDPFTPAIHTPPEVFPPPPVERLSPQEAAQKRVMMAIISTPGDTSWCPDRITASLDADDVVLESVVDEGEKVVPGTTRFPADAQLPRRSASWVKKHLADGTPSEVQITLTADEAAWGELLRTAAAVSQAAGRPIEVRGTGGGPVPLKTDTPDGAVALDLGPLDLTDPVAVVTVAAPWSRRTCPTDLFEGGESNDLEDILREADGVNVQPR